MATFNSSVLHAGTPSLAVLCPRGFPVGELACYREQAAEAVELRITRHWHDACGNLAKSLDPRLADTATPNFRWHSDLAGRTLYTESIDAGSSMALPDVAGRPLLAVSATGVSQACFHETPSLPGRLLAVTEQGAGEALPRVAERYRWAGLSPVEKHRNLAGQCVRHYDTAGLIELQNLALSGAALAQSRRLLAGEDEADWAGDDEQAWQSTLEPERYVTLRTLDTTGVQLTQTDARGHQQRQAYDVAGQLQGSWLTLQGQAEQVIVASLCYSPSGHKQQEVHGNGVITDYGLDPMTQRLTGIRAQRPGTQTSAATTLQDLRYRYDPVGNVQSVRNDAEATRFWRNQKVTAKSTFTYDSLYQLVQATGREMVGCGAQGPQLPDVMVPLPTDESALTNYTRRYSYDRAGNLIQMQHRAPASNNVYTTRMTVSNRSNRAVLAHEGLLPEQVDELFDAGGHQLELLAGQDLRWNARGELAQVKPIEREAGADDREWYRYGGDGMRLLKVNEQQAVGVTQSQRVLYLDGLELRDTGEDTRLQVIKVAAGGGAEVRMLHWASGLPAGLDNDQVRYSYHNLIGSTGLELDGQGAVISQEEYYPFGGTSVWAARSQIDAEYKIIRYSGKERDVTGLYYYGYRYYQPWAGRWLSVDPAGAVDGLNLYHMVQNNPLSLQDPDGRESGKRKGGYIFSPFVNEQAMEDVGYANAQRRYHGKSFRTVVVRDEGERKNFEQLREARIGELTSGIAFRQAILDAGGRISSMMRLAICVGAPIASIALRAVGNASSVDGSPNILLSGFSKKLNEISGLSSEQMIVGATEDIEIFTNEIAALRHTKFEVGSSVLPALEPGSSKIYVGSVHGAAGQSVLQGEMSQGRYNAGALLSDLEQMGMRKDFDDIRIVACHSADAREPRSFGSEDLAAAARSRQNVISFAEFFYNYARQVGFRCLNVTGYHGAVYINYTDHHVAEIASQLGRRSHAKRVFGKQ
ncbi:RHS repeat-associated core domain-containing protein [Pseudomonas putida]|uniref:RHS repeat protein n=1 Tax=Pseudomonas putida TaxID=303 RepID=A0A6I6XFQ1_PSEPU|nr:RHS repeat-associated core domain-containing protein [Pseudomonas putida]QHG64238.1 RHS repeat protein [Pseudomonas putida]